MARAPSQRDNYIKSTKQLKEWREKMLSIQINIKVTRPKKEKVKKQPKIQSCTSDLKNEGKPQNPKKSLLDIDQNPIKQQKQTPKWHNKSSGVNKKPNEGYDDECKSKGYDTITHEKTTCNINMFVEIDKIESGMHCKGTDFEGELKHLEKQLTNKKSKNHISRYCRHFGCFKKAPAKYPNNVYICDGHKNDLHLKLKKHEIKCDEGTNEEKEKCKKIKLLYNTFADSFKITPGNDNVEYDKHYKYPENYFSTAMAKLIYCHQQLSKQNVVSSKKSKQGKLKLVIEHLMDLMITFRQNMNDFWDNLGLFLVAIIQQLPPIPPIPPMSSQQWIGTSSLFIGVLFDLVNFLLCIIYKIVRIVNRIDEIGLIVSISAVGAGIGSIAPGAGTAAGALIGGGLAGVVVFARRLIR